MVTESWPHKPYTFRALRKTFGAMWVRCDACRRYAPLSIGAFRMWTIGARPLAARSVAARPTSPSFEPIKEAGMRDYRLDAIARPARHPAAVDRLTGCSRQSSVDYSGGELPSRKIDGRR